MAVLMTYIRYIAGRPPDNPWWLTGLVTLTKDLLKAGKLSPADATQVRSVFRWMNRNVPCPPYTARLRAGDWTEDAVSWFKPTAVEAIGRIELLIPIVRRHGFSPMRIETARVGRIVYRDALQVVAETPRGRARSE